MSEPPRKKTRFGAKVSPAELENQQRAFAAEEAKKRAAALDVAARLNQMIGPGHDVKTMQVPSGYVGLLIGTRGENIRRIIQETQCTIHVEREHERDRQIPGVVKQPSTPGHQNVYLKGAKESVQAAEQAINELLESARKREQRNLQSGNYYGSGSGYAQQQAWAQYAVYYDPNVGGPVVSGYPYGQAATATAGVAGQYPAYAGYPPQAVDPTTGYAQAVDPTTGQPTAVAQPGVGQGTTAVAGQPVAGQAVTQQPAAGQDPTATAQPPSGQPPSYPPPSYPYQPELAGAAPQGQPKEAAPAQ